MADVDYDAIIVVSFGGPEGPDDVMPFLENVTRGRDVPRDRLLEVAENYALFGGVSPINQQNRDLIAALKVELREHGPDLPIYFGNRNWNPYLADTIAEMARDGIQRALAFVTSAYSSYSGCRQYRDNIDKARAEVGATAPVIEKLRAFWNHPGFVEPMAAGVNAAIAAIPRERRSTTRIVYTAHSLPVGSARSCDYELQLRDACGLVSERLTDSIEWELAYQSRSGPPAVPWLEPDILAVLDRLAEQGRTDVINLPVGFICDHMEVKFDLDTQAAQRADQLGLNFSRVPTVGTDPRFVAMIRELILERIEPATERRALGSLAARSDVCAVDCCPAPRRPK